MASDLEQMIPNAPRELVINGETIKIDVIRVGQLPTAAQAARAVYDVLAINASGGKKMKLDFFNLIEKLADLTPLVSTMTGKPNAWVEGLTPDDFLAIVAAIIEVNIDFFTHKMLPKMTGTVQAVTQHLGQMSSNA
jgi:hypothetical protein